MSKDGFETEVSRVQSKRNLFKLIKTFWSKEANFVSQPEEFWWKKQAQNRHEDIEESYRQFLTFVEPQNEQEDFAYEGIFDKKKSPHQVSAKVGSKVDLSGFMGNLNRSKYEDEDKFIRTNVTHQVIQLQEEISNYSNSPNSANSAAVNRKIK